ncbi:MAG: hypothetical protein LH481_06975, partial [Burkholderiales bacterium]|nr:hypothetical protein [Burkholderiales bacterium]
MFHGKRAQKRTTFGDKKFAKLKHWRGSLAQNALRTAPALEFHIHPCNSRISALANASGVP